MLLIEEVQISIQQFIVQLNLSALVHDLRRELGRFLQAGEHFLAVANLRRIDHMDEVTSWACELLPVRASASFRWCVAHSRRDANREEACALDPAV